MTNIEIFHAHLDSLYWEGYAIELSNENPTAYEFERQQFFTNYKLAA